MLSSKTLRNSLNVRCKVWDVRCACVVPKRAVSTFPKGVGRPVDGCCRRPTCERSVWMFMKAEESEVGVKDCRAESSRFAQSITMRMPSMSPSTFAKNFVSSMARVFSDSERLSSSETIRGADVMLA